MKQMGETKWMGAILNGWNPKHSFASFEIISPICYQVNLIDLSDPSLEN